MRWRDLSLRQVAVGVALLGIIDWVGTQFIILPKMTQGERKDMYSGFASTPYPYLISGALACLAFWFVFSYRGPLLTQGRKLAVFAMALATVGGMLMIMVIRLTWHI